MFDSGISLGTIVDELEQEVDIAYPIPKRAYVDWANSLEQLLYREVIQEQKKLEYKCDDADNPIDLAAITPAGEEKIRFEDICTIYAQHVQLTKTTVTSGHIFPNVYYKDGDKLKLNIVDKSAELQIIYFVKPELKTVEGIDEVRKSNVKLPIEFIELMKAKLRGEAYKLANEDGLAAKWLNDYNVLLETFKVWLANKAPEFGM